MRMAGLHQVRVRSRYLQHLDRLTSVHKPTSLCTTCHTLPLLAPPTPSLPPPFLGPATEQVKGD